MRTIVCILRKEEGHVPLPFDDKWESSEDTKCFLTNIMYVAPRDGQYDRCHIQCISGDPTAIASKGNSSRLGLAHWTAVTTILPTFQQASEPPSAFQSIFTAGQFGNLYHRKSLEQSTSMVCGNSAKNTAIKDSPVLRSFEILKSYQITSAMQTPDNSGQVGLICLTLDG